MCRSSLLSALNSNSWDAFFVFDGQECRSFRISFQFADVLNLCPHFPVVAGAFVYLFPIRRLRSCFCDCCCWLVVLLSCRKKRETPHPQNSLSRLNLSTCMFIITNSSYCILTFKFFLFLTKKMLCFTALLARKPRTFWWEED